MLQIRIISHICGMRTYPAKLLMFGEHVLLLGASALAVPVPAFVGGWQQRKHPHVQSNLLTFANSEALASVKTLDTRQFQQDIAQGWVFDSNIPSGYGLGSSGALCAGIYDRYVQEKTIDPGALKAIFSQMEGYFHGASSGIDPLTSYLNAPLLIQHKTEVSVAQPNTWVNEPVVFLLDTCQPRQTGPLVNWFLEQSRSEAFSKTLSEQLLPAHESMVRAWLAADEQGFWLHLRTVSQFQLKYFTPMIPSGMNGLWEKSISGQDVHLKICGAGGGGFMLGFAHNYQAAKAFAGTHPIVFPFEQTASHG